MSELRDRLLARFREREYRHSYVESFLDSLVSAQIRALRDREKLSQEELAGKIGTTQSGVSRIESPDYSSWRIETLRKLARAFDMCLSVKFVSFGDELEDISKFGEDRLLRPSFKDDPVFQNGTADSSEDPRVNIINFPARQQIDAITSQQSGSGVESG